MLTNKKFSIKDEDITYNFILQNSILPVKTVYENFGFKGLDVLLVNHHTNNYVAYGLWINEEFRTNAPELVAFTDKFANSYNSDLKDGFLPKAILTIDGKLIEDKDEIKEFKEKELLLSNAPEKERNMFKIPKVIQ